MTSTPDPAAHPGSFASTLFGVGLLGAALLAAAILPLSTACSVSEALGHEARVEASLREEPIFYGTYAPVVGVGALVVLVPGAPLVTILFITQAINAVLLLPLLAFIALPRAIVRSWASTQPVGRGWLRSWR